MKKISLNINDLKVDSFQTESENSSSKGTVFAKSGQINCFTPVSDDPSCNQYTCAQTCGDCPTDVSCEQQTCDMATCQVIQCTSGVTDGFNFEC